MHHCLRGMDAPGPRVYSLIISVFISTSSLILYEILQPLHSLIYAALALWNGLPKDIHQFVHPPNPPLISPIYRPLATFHSRLKTELFKLYYLDSTPAPRHHTDCNRSPTLFPRLDLRGFYMAPKRNEKFGHCGLDLV